MNFASISRIVMDLHYYRYVAWSICWRHNDNMYSICLFIYVCECVRRKVHIFLKIYRMESVLLSPLVSFPCASTLDGNPDDFPMIPSCLLNERRWWFRLLHSAIALSRTSHTLNNHHLPEYNQLILDIKDFLIPKAIPENRDRLY